MRSVSPRLSPRLLLAAAAVGAFLLSPAAFGAAAQETQPADGNSGGSLDAKVPMLVAAIGLGIVLTAAYWVVQHRARRDRSPFVAQVAAPRGLRGEIAGRPAVVAASAGRLYFWIIPGLLLVAAGPLVTNALGVPFAGFAVVAAVMFLVGILAALHVYGHRSTSPDPTAERAYDSSRPTAPSFEMRPGTLELPAVYSIDELVDYTTGVVVPSVRLRGFQVVVTNSAGAAIVGHADPMPSPVAADGSGSLALLMIERDGDDYVIRDVFDRAVLGAVREGEHSRAVRRLESRAASRGEQLRLMKRVTEIRDERAITGPDGAPIARLVQEYPLRADIAMRHRRVIVDGAGAVVAELDRRAAWRRSRIDVRVLCPDALDPRVILATALLAAEAMAYPRQPWFGLAAGSS